MSEKQMVFFKLGRGEYAIPIEKVQEIIKTPDITNLPNTPQYLQGVINLRNRVIPVIDLHVKLGSGEGHKEDSRIIVVNSQDRTLGFIVDTVTEVLKISEDLIEKALNQESGSLSGIARIGERLIVLLDLDKIAVEG